MKGHILGCISACECVCGGGKELTEKGRGKHGTHKNSPGFITHDRTYAPMRQPLILTPTHPGRYRNGLFTNLKSSGHLYIKKKRPGFSLEAFGTAYFRTKNPWATDIQRKSQGYPWELSEWFVYAHKLHGSGKATRIFP